VPSKGGFAGQKKKRKRDEGSARTIGKEQIPITRHFFFHENDAVVQGFPFGGVAKTESGTKEEGTRGGGTGQKKGYSTLPLGKIYLFDGEIGNDKNVQTKKRSNKKV